MQARSVDSQLSVVIEGERDSYALAILGTAWHPSHCPQLSHESAGKYSSLTRLRMHGIALVRYEAVTTSYPLSSLLLGIRAQSMLVV